MYRKNLMRVCLAAIMAATVVTTSVPVYAAEPVATKQEAAKTRTITIKYQEEDGTLVSSYDLLGQPDELGAVNQKVVKSHLPNGCELVNPKDSYEVGADGVVLVTVKNNEKPATKSAKINYYDEVAGKQAAEVEVQNLALDTDALGLKVVKSYLPEGYELVEEKNSYAINGEYVYVGVKAIETEKPEKPATKSVKINYYDEVAGKQAAEVEVQNLALDTDALGLKVVKSYLPEGYELVEEKNSYAINGEYVYVGVKAIETEKPEKPATKSVKINYYDEVAGKQAAEVEVQNLALDTDALGLKVVKSYLPEGYELVEEKNSYAVNDGYVYVAVKAIKKAEVKTTLNITFETKDGEVVDTKLVETTVQGAATDSWTFMLGTDFFLPTGYKLAEGVDQTTNIQVPFGATAGHTVIVEEIAEVKEVKINFYDEEAGKQVEERTVEVAADATHLNVTKDMAPEGYEVMLLGELPINDGYVYVNVKKLAEVKEVKINFYDEEAGKQVEERTVEVAADATHLNVTKDMAPKGYEIMLLGDLEIRDGYVYVNVKKLAEVKEVKINFYDEEAGKQVEERTVEVAADATHLNVTKDMAPKGYEIMLLGDLEIRDGYVYVNVKKLAEVKEVKINFYDEEAGKQVEERTVEVAADATHLNVTKDMAPKGYEIMLLGDLEIRDGYVYVNVKKLAEVKEVRINFYDEEAEKQVEERVVEVAADATYLNVTKDMAPKGYEIMLLGDLPIRDGYVYVAVKKLEVVDPETPVDPDKPVNPEKPEKPEKPQEDDKDKDNQKDDKKDKDDKKSPKTSDEASPLAATATAGLSLAAILALLKKRR